MDTQEFLKTHFTTRIDRILAHPEKSIQPNGGLDRYIQGHIDGKKRIGFYCLDKNSQVRWGVIDLDFHNGGAEVKADIKSFVTSFRKLSAEVQLPYNFEVSKSGGGHIWLFFKEPIPAIKVRRFLLGLVQIVGKQANLPREWVDKIEVFPKQNQLKKTESYYGEHKIVYIAAYRTCFS